MWNKTGWADRGGTKVSWIGRKAEWLTRDAPELRICRRSSGSGARPGWRARARRTSARPGARPGGGRSPAWREGARYLLTGFLQCAWCGGGLIVHRKTKAKYRWDYLACHTHHARGSAICRNRLSVRMDMTEREVLNLVRDELLNPRVVQRALQLAVEQVRPGTDQHDADRREITEALRQIEVERGRFVGSDPEGG